MCNCAHRAQEKPHARNAVVLSVPLTLVKLHSPLHFRVHTLKNRAIGKVAWPAQLDSM